MRRPLLKALLVVLLLIAAFWTWSRLRGPQKVPVTVVAVARGEVAATVTNSRAGTVKARRRARMSPQLGGRAVEIPFREGQRVRQGDVLLRLDPVPYQARVRLAQEDLGTASAQQQQACLAAERAERERERLARLAADGIVSTDGLDAATSAARTAEAACRAGAAAVERARAAVAVAQVDLDQTVLRAPFDGIVADLSIELGEWTTPSPPAVPVPPVIDLIDPSSIYISAPMDEVDSSRIQVDQEARISVDSYRDRNFTGKVVRIAPFVLDREEQNRTVEVEAEIDRLDPGVTLLPGTSADVEVILERRPDVLRVPTSAVISGSKVLVLEGGVLAERSLQLGLKNWDFTEVLSGLTAGDSVVTSLDRPEVKAGAAATVVPAEGAPAR
ncbi:MAG: efflux RND transporter periplasmic adaptor subunit [Thermoanaerobaculia bacterium]